MAQKEGFDWNRVIALTTIGLLVCAVIPVVLMVWDRIPSQGQPTPLGEAAITGRTMAFALGAMFLGIILNLVAALVSHRSKKTPPIGEGIDPATHKQVVDNLNACESTVRHWQGEVERVRLDFNNRLETADKLWRESKREAGDLGDQLSAAHTKLKEFAVPRARLKIKHAEYHMLGKVGTDVTQTLDQMVLDEKLVLDNRYNELLRVDPFKGVPKHLTIQFLHGPREFSVTVPEDTKVTLPFPYADHAP